MIDFEIEFLISFTKPKRIEKKDPKKKAQKETKVNKNKKKSLSSNIEKTNGQKLSITTDEYAHDWCHIEYCILDNVLPFVEINVATWGAGTYVFLENYFQPVSAVIIDDIVYVYFCMHHKTCEFEHEQVIQFKNNSLIFTISQNQTKVIPVSDFENWKKQFIITKKSIDPNHVSEKWSSELLERHFSFDTVTGKEGNCRINSIDKDIIINIAQRDPFEVIIGKKIQEINQRLKDLPQNPVQTSVKIKKNKNAKIDNTKMQSDTKLVNTGEVAKLYLKSEELVARKSPVVVEQLIIGSTIKFVGIYAKSSQILTNEQNDVFLPLIVSLKSVEDLPIPFIEKMNLKNIYAQYEFGNILKITETEKFSIKQKDIFIEDTRVFFLSGPEERRQFDAIRPSELKLQEALSTRMMVVKLYGEEKFNELNVEPSLFGENLMDKFISTPGHEMVLNYKRRTEKGPVFLGSACFKLIQLLNGLPVIETSSVMSSAPVSTWDPICDRELFMKETWNNEEQESLLKKLFLRGQIPDSVLLKACTRIILSVSSPTPLTSLSLEDQYLIPNIYHRIAVVFKNQKFAFDVFKEIMHLNDTIIDPLSVSKSLEQASMINYDEIDDYGLKSHLSEDLFNQFSNSLSLASPNKKLSDDGKSLCLSSLDKIITGFFLDNQEECIMVLEGSPYLFYNIIEMLTSMILPKDGKVMFDNTLFFTQRLYYDFFPLTNIFYIQVKTPLNTLLQQTSHYLSKNISDQSVQALLQIDLLRRSPTLDCIAINQLFPSSKQLICFNLSFGVTIIADDSSTYTSSL